MKKRFAAVLWLLVFVIISASCGRTMPASSSEEAVFYGRTLDQKAKGLLRAARPYGKELLAELLETILKQPAGGEATALLSPDGTPLRSRAPEIRADLDSLLQETYTLGAFFDSTDFLLEQEMGIPRLTLITAVNEAAAAREEYLPGGAYFCGAWSEDLVRETLLSSIREGRTDDVFVFTEELPMSFIIDEREGSADNGSGGEAEGDGSSGGYADAVGEREAAARENDPADSHARAVKEAAERILDESAVAVYSLYMSRAEASAFDDGVILTVSTAIRDDIADSIWEMTDMSDGEIATDLISRNSDWSDLFAIRCESGRDWRETSHIIEVAAANDCADLACPLDSYYTSCCRGADDQVLEFSCDFSLSPAAREEKTEILRETVEAEAADLLEQSEGLSEAERYWLVTDRVMALTYYDEDLADRISSDALAGEDWFLLSAYGALVEGHTVCSGYAAAMKALCDELDLPCWIVSGTAYVDGEAEGHSWNAVRIGGETYYIDATFLDAGHEDYFLFTRNEFGDREAEDYWFLPW